MPKKADKVGGGTVRLDFADPQDPLFVHLWDLLPYDGRVTSIKIDYITLEEHKAREDRAAKMKAAKRHVAAVKANATRKARKAEKEATQP